MLGKLMCGLWLVRLSMPLSPRAGLRKVIKVLRSKCLSRLSGQSSSPVAETVRRTQQQDDHPVQADPNIKGGTMPARKTSSSEANDTISSLVPRVPLQPESSGKTTNIMSQKTGPVSRSVSLYPGAILGFAMVSRGEIGFLISSVADGNGIFSANGNNEIFLIVTWSIVLCTIIGPLVVGLLVRRVKRLETAKEKQQGGGRDVLGAWGVH